LQKVCDHWRHGLFQVAFQWDGPLTQNAPSPRLVPWCVECHNQCRPMSTAVDGMDCCWRVIRYDWHIMGNVCNLIGYAVIFIFLSVYLIVPVRSFRLPYSSKPTYTCLHRILSWHKQTGKTQLGVRLWTQYKKSIRHNEREREAT